MKNIKLTSLSILFVVILSACSKNYSPKPLGYFRIDLSEKTYNYFTSDCVFNFLRPLETKIINGKKNCWHNIYYPNHDATVYLTYKLINSNLADIIDDTHKLAYDHAVKSDGIIETVYSNEEQEVYGVLYDIYGNSASNLQFFVTDSSSHFLRGSLYFNTIPNSDSINPIKQHIKEDILVLIESLKWI